MFQFFGICDLFVHIPVNLFHGRSHPDNCRSHISTNKWCGLRCENGQSKILPPKNNRVHDYSSKSPNDRRCHKLQFVVELRSGRIVSKKGTAGVSPLFRMMAI